jgi:integrase
MKASPANLVIHEPQVQSPSITSHKGRKKGGRKNWEGYVFKRNGIYYLHYQVNKKRQSRSLGTRIKSEALEKAKGLMQPKDAQTELDITYHIGKAKRLISENNLPLIDVWREYVSSGNRPDSGLSTLKNYENQWRQFTEWLKSDWGHITQLSQIDDDIVLKYADYLKHERKLAPATFNAHKQTLSLITKTLAKKAGITGNPWECVANRALDTVVKKELTQDEVMRLLQKLEDPDYNISDAHEWQVIFYAGAFAGLRLADAVQLTWDCVDQELTRLSLVPQKTARKLKRVNLPIHPGLREKLIISRDRRNKSQDSHICPNLAGRYLSNSWDIKKEVIKIFRDAGFETTQKMQGRNKSANVIGFHSLRHSFVSFCANAGVPLAIVQSLVGHGSPAMTRHYTHISRESAEKAINALPIMNSAIGANQLSECEKNQQILVLLTAASKLTQREKQILAIIKQDRNL